MGLAFTIVQASGAAFVAAVWIASVVWTARDARRRCRDRGDVRIAITTAVLLPFAGAAFYALARPCEDPLEARERKLHLRLLEATLFDPGERCLACLTPLAPDFEPDLAIMDVKMPKLDGIDAARRILDERPIPIVMLTAYGQDELVSRAVEAGVFGYLVKPFRESDLLPAIQTARARHEELAAVREEAESLAEALAARKTIERAKGLLMEKEGLSEQDAFARLRKASQVAGRPMKVVAEAVLATFEQDS